MGHPKTIDQGADRPPIGLLYRGGGGTFLGVLDPPPSLVRIGVVDDPMLADEVVFEVETERDVGFPRITGEEAIVALGCKVR